MSITLQLRDMLRSLLSHLCDIYHIDAPETATYPYAVEESRKITTTSRYNLVYAIEINVWDKYKTYSRAETIADQIESVLDGECILIDGGAVYITANIKQNVDDSDKQIKRMQLILDAHIVYKGDMK